MRRYQIVYKASVFWYIVDTHTNTAMYGAIFTFDTATAKCKALNEAQEMMIYLSEGTRGHDEA